MAKWSYKGKVKDHFSPSEDVGIDFTGDPGLTDQSMAKDCDVNVIIDRFMKTGVLPGADAERLYEDFSDVTTFHEAMNIVRHAQEQFDSLDAKVRKRFANDPAQFLEFMADENNGSELVKLGLASIRPSEWSEAPIADSRASNEVPKKGKASPSPAKKEISAE